MKTFLLFLCSLFVASIAEAQSELMVFQDWTSTSGSQNFFYKNVVKTDLSSNVYILGATVNDSNNYDILLAKYDRRGTLTWMRQYNGAGDGDDMGTGLYVDGSGNVYVTGTVTDTNSKNVVTIKYNSSGTQQWLKIYNGPGNDFDSGSDIITDGSGNVYVTGTSTNASSYTSVFAAKYNSSGTQQWVTNYNVAANLNDAGVKISLIGYNVAIAGVHQSSSTSYNYFTAQFNTANGNFVMIMSSGAYNVYGVDQVNDMVRDASGNIYIAGATPVTGQGYDYYVVKLNSSLGLTWQRTFNGADSLDDFAQGVRVDGSGNVYTTGYSTTLNEGRNITTIKYNSSGTQQWILHYNDTLDGDDEAAAMAMDASGNIYVTGYISTETDNADYFTMKYNPSGTLLWSIHGDGNAHLNDKATNIVIASDGGIIITGESEVETGVFEYKTIKYIEKQVIIPTDYDSESPQASFSFYPNKGQLINTSDSLVPEIKYYTNNTNPAFYILDNSYCFVFAKIDTCLSSQDTLHRIDVDFQKSKVGSKTFPLEEKLDYLNYFLKQCPKGITEVRGNQQLITTDIYENIDFIYSSNQNGIKNYFIIKPGGDPTDISLEYTGASSFYLDSVSNNLTIYGSVGNISFDRPTVYQLDSSNNIIQVNGWTADWTTNGASNIFTFNVGSYNTTIPLVIQVDKGHNPIAPILNNYNLEWSTYFGGISSDHCKEVETNNANEVWVGGETMSANFPVVTNITPLYIIDDDCYIAKFSYLTHPIWLTYFGGDGWDGIFDMKLDSKENVYFVGSTSSTDFPNNSSIGIDDDTRNGSQDGYFLVVNFNGQSLLCDSYIGGSDWDFPFSIDIAQDPNGYNTIVIAGMTYSGSGFPVLNSSNAYNQTSDFGSRQSFIMRLDNNYDNVWCSLFGGSGDEAFTDVAIGDGLNRIMVCGWTTTSNYSSVTCGVPTDGGFPHCTPTNAYTQTYGGGDLDLTIAEFNNNNQLVWSTYFGGNQNDAAGNIDSPNPRMCFSGNDLYLASTVLTTPLSTFPLFPSNYPGAYNQPLATTTNILNGNIIISRFNSNRLQTWCTAFGGFSVGNAALNMSFGGICSGPDNSIFISGYADADYVQSSNLCTVPSLGSGDFPICNYSGLNYMEVDAGTTYVDEHREFIAGFDANDNIVWSTRFGFTSYLSEGNDIIASPNKLYVVGYCDPQSLPYTLWCFDQTNVDPFDYYQDSENGTGVISRFDLSGITTSINDNRLNMDNTLIIVPNPAKDYICIQMKNSSSEFKRICLLDAMGCLISCKEKFDSESTVIMKIDFLPQGVYFIRVEDGNDNLYLSKFIKL